MGARSSAGLSAHIQIRIERLAFIELNTERVQHHRNLRVLPAGEDDIHALLFAEMRFQRRPGFVADEVVGVKIVASADEGGVSCAPVCAGAGFDRGDFGVRETCAFADLDVLGPLVTGATIVAGAEDDNLAFAPRQIVSLREHVAAPTQKTGQRIGRVRERAKNVERRAAGNGGARERLALGLCERCVAEGGDARGFEVHGRFVAALSGFEHRRLGFRRESKFGALPCL